MFVGMGILVYLMVNNFIGGLGGSFSATEHLERDVGDIMIWPSSVRHAHVGRIHIYCNWWVRNDGLLPSVTSSFSSTTAFQVLIFLGWFVVHLEPAS